MKHLALMNKSIHQMDSHSYLLAGYPEDGDLCWLGGIAPKKASLSLQFMDFPDLGTYLR